MGDVAMMTAVEAEVVDALVNCDAVIMSTVYR